MSRRRNAGCLGILLEMFGGGRAAAPPAAQVQVKQYLLSAAEASFYRVLRGAVGGRAEIFVQIPLGHLLIVSGQSNSARTSARNRFDRKTVDFLLCDPQGLRPLLAIELDDSTHTHPKRQSRDSQVDGLLAAAGLPLLRLPCRRSYDTREIAAALEKHLAPLRQGEPGP